LSGIRNCDTMKKARRWLDDAGVAYEFHDYKKAGVDPVRLKQWCGQLGWEPLLNRRGTTWRKLDEAQKQDLDEARAIALMLEHPSMIKRPVLDVDGRIELGFSAESYAALFA
ncbi:MAG: ArsC family reductase, partial [Mariprofundaceae bacterium]|nr:ArsC family reductase [Mariprofundaceae bacterium]